MKQFFVYWLWPNPAGWHYGDHRVMALLGLSLLLIVGSFALSIWRKSRKNQRTRMLASGWPTASFWFGVVALVLTISRVEMIQFLAMKVLWLLWALIFALYVLFQVIRFRRMHYSVLASPKVIDERDRYLPRKK